MDDVVIMRVAHGGANLLKQQKPVAHREFSAVAPGAHAHAFHVIHHHIRKALLGCAAVDQARDMGGVQIRQDLSFIPKALEDVLTADRGIHNLDRDALAVLAIRALRQIPGSHAAAADLPYDTIWPYRTAGRRLTRLE